MDSNNTSGIQIDLSRLNFEKGNGLVTVVTQDAASGAVLMVAHADRAALERCLESGEMYYMSRSRGLWHKGATSGNTQRIVSLVLDCDGDAILARVVPAGPACHTGGFSCFSSERSGGDALSELDRTIAERDSATADGATDIAPAGALRSSYTQKLLGDRNLRLKKIGEESAEFIAACADGDREKAVDEAADLLYHIAVALRSVGGSLEELRAELAARSRLSTG